MNVGKFIGLAYGSKKPQLLKRWDGVSNFYIAETLVAYCAYKCQEKPNRLTNI